VSYWQRPSPQTTYCSDRDVDSINRVTCYISLALVLAAVVHFRYHNVMMKMRRIIKGVTKHFTTQFDFDEVTILYFWLPKTCFSRHIMLESTDF